MLLCVLKTYGMQQVSALFDHGIHIYYILWHALTP